MTDDGIDFDELLRVFRAEADDVLAGMEQTLVALELAPDDAEQIHTLFRAAHTLKGNAASIGLDAVVALAHHAEELLDALRQRRFGVTPGLITLLLRCVDGFHRLLNGGVADASLLDALARALETGDYDGASGDAATLNAGAKSSLRVGVEKLDALMNLAGELTIVRGRMRALIDALPQPPLALLDAQEQFERLAGELQTRVTGMRTVPIGPVFHSQVRVVRDLAHATGKLVQLEFRGEDVELDTAVVDKLRDPLTHMVRNAIAHGIESPNGRAAAGKSPAGVLVLSARHDGGQIVVEVSDDGAGLDVQRIAERARAKGLISASAVISDDEVQRLIFARGFSTADSVNEIAGRGVGMDVVQQNITALRGTIDVRSVRGEGTTISLRLPLTLAIIDGLSVGLGGATYVMPVDAVLECLDADESDVAGRTAGVLELRGRALPFLDLAAAVGAQREAASRRGIVVVRHRNAAVGLVVDRLVGRDQVVLKPLAEAMPRAAGIAGATVLGNGDVALVLDVARVIDQHRLTTEAA